MNTLQVDLKTHIFNHCRDGILLSLMEDAHQIAVASMAAEPRELLWSEEDIDAAITAETMSKWEGHRRNIERRRTLEQLRENIHNLEIPDRPLVMEVTTIPQYGIGELAVDLLIEWPQPILKLVRISSDKETEPTSRASDFRWEVHSDDTSTEHMAILAIDNLGDFRGPEDEILSYTLRKLTLFSYYFQKLGEISDLWIPDCLYLLSHEKYAPALKHAGFGSILKTEKGYSVVRPEA